MKRFFLIFIVALDLLSKIVEAQEYEVNYHVTDHYCHDCIEQSRTDEIPQTHVAWATDEFLTGYIQSLIDMHYFEFCVKVHVSQGIVYVFDLPIQERMAQNILCFINDVPCVQGIERVECSPDEFFCTVYGDDTAVSVPCSPRYRVGGIWLPQTTILFAPLIADPRQVINSAALRFNDDVIGKKVGAVSFGDDFGIYRWLDLWCWHGDLEFDIEAGIFAVFDLDHPEACLVNTDFFVAGMFAYAVKNWSFRFRLWHLSCHLGDEFLLCNDGFDRRNLSDEGVDFFASYQCGRALRIYAGVGDIFDRDEEFPEKPFYAEAGAEIRVFGCRDCYDKLYLQPFFAMHFRSWQEHDFDIDQTYALGVEYSKIQGVGKKIRIFFEYHDGFSREGQFVKCRSSYSAIRVTYGF